MDKDQILHKANIIYNLMKAREELVELCKWLNMEYLKLEINFDSYDYTIKTNTSFPQFKPIRQAMIDAVEKQIEKIDLSLNKLEIDGDI